MYAVQSKADIAESLWKPSDAQIREPDWTNQQTEGNRSPNI